MSHGVAILKNMGMLNTMAPDLRDMQGSRRLTPTPYCSSFKCLKAYRETRSAGEKCPSKVLKQNVRKSADDCPDCGYALIWKSE